MNAKERTLIAESRSLEYAAEDSKEESAQAASECTEHGQTMDYTTAEAMDDRERDDWRAGLATRDLTDST